MSERNLVSVVIPTYNRAGTIGRAVDSVLSQDYPHLEVVVVDDGSTDDTADLMAEKYTGDGRVRFFQYPNGGCCVARNRGLREARGEFVAMLDSDDYWLPGKLSLQVRILQANPGLSMVWSDMDAVDVSGQVVYRRYLREMYSGYKYFPALLDLFDSEQRTEDGVPYYMGNLGQALILGNLVHTSTVVARADRLAHAGDYDKSMSPSEDQDYYYRVCQTGPVAFIDAVTLHYQVGAADAATSSSQGLLLATSSLRVFERLRTSAGNGLKLPQGSVRQAESELWAWVGIASFHHGLMAEARRFLTKRVARPPIDRRLITFLMLACMPLGREILRVVSAARSKSRP